MPTISLLFLLLLSFCHNLWPFLSLLVIYNDLDRKWHMYALNYLKFSRLPVQVVQVVAVPLMKKTERGQGRGILIVQYLHKLAWATHKGEIPSPTIRVDNPLGNQCPLNNRRRRLEDRIDSIEKSAKVERVKDCDKLKVAKGKVSLYLTCICFNEKGATLVFWDRSRNERHLINYRRCLRCLPNRH
jgi:hypothetical protein